jgi:hypothetical protein
MASRADGDANRISILCEIARWSVSRCLVLGFVQLKADVRQVVKFWNGGTLDFGLQPALQDGVEKSVDVRLLCEVNE